MVAGATDGLERVHEFAATLLRMAKILCRCVLYVGVARRVGLGPFLCAGWLADVGCVDSQPPSGAGARGHVHHHIEMRRAPSPPLFNKLAWWGGGHRGPLPLSWSLYLSPGMYVHVPYPL